MKRRLRLILIAAMVAFSAIAPSSAFAKGWEALRYQRSDVRKIGGDSELEIKATRGVIMINTSRTVNVKIFSILGSMIANDTLQPGIYQFQVPAHGVYIIKAGDLTYKLAL